MCWSGEASATLATVGFVSTAHVAIKGEDKALWIPLAYFSLMELLQAFTYSVIGQCDRPLNQILTLLGVIHISLQPFFINMAAMYFIPAEVRRHIAKWVYGLSLAGSGIFLLWLYPFSGAGICAPHSLPLCGEQLCSIHGSWHIAWQVPLNGFGWLMLGYLLPAFVLPIAYGSWRCTFYHLITGPILARLTTSNLNEWPAVWCLLSIGLLLLLIKTPVRTFLHVSDWPLWTLMGARLVPAD